MHEERDSGDHDKREGEADVRAHHTPDSTLIHDLFSDSTAPGGRCKREQMRNNGDRDEHAEAVDHMLVEFFGLLDRQSRRPDAIRIVEVIRHRLSSYRDTGRPGDISLELSQRMGWERECQVLLTPRNVTEN